MVHQGRDTVDSGTGVVEPAFRPARTDILRALLDRHLSRG
ncbi:hypothetical protein SUDANB126_04808 [Streptomyces sp. enrichment culture]